MYGIFEISGILEVIDIFLSFVSKFWSIITSSIFERFFWFWSQNIANACTKKSISALCSFMLSYKQYIRIIYFSCFFSIFPENVQKIYILKKNDIWQYTSVAKTFLFNINLELQKSDENWRRNNTLKSAHTVKKQLWEKRKWSEPTSDERSYKYPHRVSLNTAKLPLNELIFYGWMRFLVHNIIGDYLKLNFFSIFQVGTRSP